MNARVAVALVLIGCGGEVAQLASDLDAGVSDAGVIETDSGTDAGAPPVADAGSVDAGSSTVIDAGAPRVDAGVDAGAAGGDAGPSAVDAGAVAFDAGTATVSVLIAQGRLGRHIVSCDDGRTWVANHDEAPGQMCGDPPNVECFHHPWAPQGLVQAGNAVVATWGWGMPGMIRRTLDGIQWESVLPGTSFAGIMYGNGRVMAAGGTPSISAAQGATGSWVNGGGLNVGSVPRHGAFFSAGGGRFMIMLDGLLKISDDNGASWVTTPTPSGCVDSAMSILTHESTGVILKYGGQACVTRDRGNTWSMITIGSGTTSSGVVAQGAFYTWNGHIRYRSTDGVTWVAATGPTELSIGPVAVTPSGTFVAFKGGWQSEYDGQRIYRSADGITWETLPTSAYVRSHPITHLISAQVRASTTCPR